MHIIRLSIYSLPLMCLCYPVLIQAADPLKSALDNKLEAQNESIQSQKRIDTLADDTRDMVQEYKTLLRSIDGLKAYNDQLDILIKKQLENLSSIQRQLGHIEGTQRNIVPLMLRMIEVLDEFISLDLPFLVEERQIRLTAIKDIMDRPDVSLPDKFRRIMEAYQIEMEYGRTIEAYSGDITINGQTQAVELLRIGRLALLYSSLDHKNIGQWDKYQKQWKPLDSSYKRGIQQGLKIANKQAPPDLFKIPVFAPEIIQGEKD